MRNLHSSMDRLETDKKDVSISILRKFTFQYGQIRNTFYGWLGNTSKKIYIPVWIDQKLQTLLIVKKQCYNLHSSMDRLETICEY